MAGSSAAAGAAATALAALHAGLDTQLPYVGGTVRDACVVVGALYVGANALVAGASLLSALLPSRSTPLTSYGSWAVVTGATDVGARCLTNRAFCTAYFLS